MISKRSPDRNNLNNKLIEKPVRDTTADTNPDTLLSFAVTLQGTKHSGCHQHLRFRTRKWQHLSRLHIIG